MPSLNASINYGGVTPVEVPGVGFNASPVKITEREEPQVTMVTNSLDLMLE